jgi:hypothetical protein
MAPQDVCSLRHSIADHLQTWQRNLHHDQKKDPKPPSKRPRNPKPRHVRKQYLINIPITIRREEEWEVEKKMLAWREALEFATENDDRNPDSDIDEDDG